MTSFRFETSPNFETSPKHHGGVSTCIENGNDEPALKTSHPATRKSWWPHTDPAPDQEVRELVGERKLVAEHATNIAQVLQTFI